MIETNYVLVIDQVNCTLIVKKCRDMRQREDFIRRAEEQTRGHATLVLPDGDGDAAFVDAVAHAIDAFREVVPPEAEFVDAENRLVRH